MPLTYGPISAVEDLRELSQAAFVVATPDIAAHACQVSDCMGLTYAELRAPAGRINVCFKHFQELRDQPSSPEA